MTSGGVPDSPRGFSSLVRGEKGAAALSALNFQRCQTKSSQ